MAEELPQQPKFDDGAECRGSPMLGKQLFAEQALANTELGFEVVVTQKLEERGIYDATRLKARKPELHKASIVMLGMGVSAKMISEILGLDIRTVNAVADEAEAQGAIPPYKERTVKTLKAIVGLITDTLIDKARRGELGTIDLGIVIEKIELLTGGATARIEHRMSAEEEDTLRFFSQARESLRTIELEAENLGAKGGAAGAVAALPEPRPGAPVIDVGGDAEPVQTNRESGNADSESVSQQP